MDSVADRAFPEQVRALTALLEEIAADWTLLNRLPPADRQRLHLAIAQIYNPDPAVRRRRVKAAERSHRAAAAKRDQAALDRTGIRTLRSRPVFTTPNVFAPDDFEPEDRDDESDAPPAPDVSSTAESRPCYICKTPYTEIHHFYDQLCPPCAVFNYRKRTELADLSSRVALLTGGRVKIGYQVGLKLLRCGAHLIVTTRFPNNAAERYAAEPDYAEWRHRLEVHGLDLRHTPSVDAFCHELLATRDRLDFIVNNACQTVRRPPEFYAHMMAGERASALALHDASTVPPSSAELSQVPLLPEELATRSQLFPSGQLDQDLQQIDLRDRNSWRMRLADVPAVELLEVHLVNAVAPFILNARLKPLMLRSSGRDKHIVNVSAVEGQFYRRFKTTRHPHTNMAKAALNMMTRTAAADYHAVGIHMNSVDTGWVTDEDAAEIAARKRIDQRFHPPLDIVDGAARIVDPILEGINTGTHIWGKFLKDFRETDW